MNYTFSLDIDTKMQCARLFDQSDWEGDTFSLTDPQKDYEDQWHMFNIDGVEYDINIHQPEPGQWMADIYPVYNGRTSASTQIQCEVNVD